MSVTEPSLDALAIRHGADKSSKVHGYTRAYERHFAPLRHLPIALLEIGVGNGASRWADRNSLRNDSFSSMSATGYPPPP